MQKFINTSPFFNRSSDRSLITLTLSLSPKIAPEQSHTVNRRSLTAMAGSTVLIGLTTLFGLTAISASSLATESQADDENYHAPIIITATRTAQTANETIASVTVITEEDIQRRQVRSVEELLRGETGLQVINNGGRGKVTSVLMRGTNSEHVLVLIDGIKVGSASLGITSFQDIPVTQIERIEIVRGPRSSLYGAEALGGVIQIFTKRGEGAWKPSLSLTAGSDETYEGTVGVRGGSDAIFYNYSLSAADSEGFDSCDGAAATDFTACFNDEPDDDGYQNWSGSASVGSRFDNGSEVTLSYLHSDSETEFDGNFQNESETVQQVLGLNSAIAINDIWWLKIVAGRSADESDNFKDSVFSSRFDTERDSVTLQNDFILFSRDTLTIGADYNRDEIDSNEDFTVTERENYGGFIQYLAALGGHDIELSGRYDDNEQFGYQVTGGIAYGANVSDHLRFITSYGTAYHAPTFNDLYFPDFGNPELQPEESRSFEIGFKGNYEADAGEVGAANWSFVWFNTLIDDLIGFDENFDAINVDKAKIKGVEFSYDNRMHQHWLVGFGFTWQSPTSESGATRGNLLPRRAERSGRLDVDYLATRWSAGMTLTAASSSFDDRGNTRELGAWQTVDLRGEMGVTEDLSLQLKVENLFDKEYETASDYNQPGLGFFLTLLYQP